MALPIKKVVKVVKAVATGYGDYVQKVKGANKEAEARLKGSFGNSSTGADASRVAKEISKIKKERGISLRSSVRSKLGI